MPKPYSEDLRWRTVWLNVVRGMTSYEIADTLFMCERSVQRYLSFFHTTGSVTPKKSTGGPDKILSEFEQFSILQTLIHNPSTFLHELQSQLYDTTGKWVHASTICRTIHQYNFTHKKVQVIALQRSEEARIQFMAEVSGYHPDMFIWVDETGSDKRNSIRSYGYALRGMRPVCHHLRVGSRRISAIPVMTTRGIEDVYTTTNSVNGEIFEQFIVECVLPIILPFDGNNPRSVLVLDNASIHHLERIEEIIGGVGARIIFLPPYSPDLMPLEEVFAKVKSILKANDKAYVTTSNQMANLLVKMAFCTVTNNDCLHYIHHAGYL